MCTTTQSFRVFVKKGDKYTMEYSCGHTKDQGYVELIEQLRKDNTPYYVLDELDQPFDVSNH